MENLEFNSFFKTNKSINKDITLTDFDRKNGTKVYCNKPYAQELYNLINSSINESTDISKDLKVGENYKIKATTISYDDSEIYAEEINSKSSVIIPFKEYGDDVSTLIDDENLRTFSIKIYKVSNKGMIFGSKKKALIDVYYEELFNNYNKNKWFTVSIKKLVNGGYIATYKDQIECFLPGSQAAANIITDFNALLNTQLTVMVDSFDSSNNLFIISYKKYISSSLPFKINDLVFGKKYTGKLTNKPYAFGIFIEFENYYTGLLHKSEFNDYEFEKRKYQRGDLIDFYIKDVIYKKKSYNIVLTLDKENINLERLKWQHIKEKTENCKFYFTLNKLANSISIDVDGSNLEITLTRNDLKKNVLKYQMIKILKVDLINKKFNYEFINR